MHGLFYLLFFSILSLKCADDTSDKWEDENQRVFIGIPVMKITDKLLLELKPELEDKDYISASYVKFVESAGARVVAITPDLPTAELRRIIRSVNGLLFPGGEINLKDSGYYRLTKQLYGMATKENKKGRHFPILGICRGMQALVVHELGSVDKALVLTDSSNYTTNLKWRSIAYSSSLFRSVPARLWTDSAKYPITAHFHKYGVRPSAIRHSKIVETLATSRDRKGKVFCSIIQGKKLPFYGIQFHPEKVLFEWASSINIPHSTRAVRFAQNLAVGFIEEARQNSNQFTLKEEEMYTMDKRNPMYIGYLIESHSPFVQIYVFPQPPSEDKLILKQKYNDVKEEKYKN